MRRLLVLPVLLLAACGSDSDALSKDEFIEQGDAICADFEERGDALPEPESEEDIEQFLGAFTDLVRDFRDEVADLEPPEDGEELHQQMLDSVDEAIGLAEDAEAAAADGDMERVGELLDEADQTVTALNEDLADYGFDDCSEA